MRRVGRTRWWPSCGHRKRRFGDGRETGQFGNAEVYSRAQDWGVVGDGGGFRSNFGWRNRRGYRAIGEVRVRYWIGVSSCG